MASGGKKSIPIPIPVPVPAAGEIDWNKCVVSTAAGDGKQESRAGSGTAALDRPYAVIQSGDGKSLLFTESGSHRVRSFNLADTGIDFARWRIGIQKR